MSNVCQWNNVGKGSRQNGSVTSRKGLALRAGSVWGFIGKRVVAKWAGGAWPRRLLPFARGWVACAGEARLRIVGAWTGAARASPAVARVGRRPTADLELELHLLEWVEQHVPTLHSYCIL